MKTLLIAALASLTLGGTALADDGWLGVQLQAIDKDLSKSLKLPDDRGALVDEVVDDSPAAAAGLRHGDVIVAFAGKPVHEVKDLTKAVRKASPGDEVDVTVLRDGKQQDLKVTLGERDQREVFVIRRGDKGDGDLDEDRIMDKALTWRQGDGDDFQVFTSRARGGYLGIGLQDLTEQLGKHFGVDDGKGALVSEVKPDSPAARAGLAAGDVVVEADGEAVADTEELRDALAKHDDGDEVGLTVIRDGKRRNLTATLAAWPEGEAPRAFRFDPEQIKRLHQDMPRLREFMPREGRRELRVLRGDGAERQDLDKLRGEVDRLRAELDALRQELRDR